MTNQRITEFPNDKWPNGKCMNLVVIGTSAVRYTLPNGDTMCTSYKEYQNNFQRLWKAVQDGRWDQELPKDADEKQAKKFWNERFGKDYEGHEFDPIVNRVAKQGSRIKP